MQLTAPGVYVEELSSGVHTIVGVATSIAAFVGYTDTGLDATPVTLNSFADFERGFGGLASDSELSYAVQQFFINGGTQAIVVRVPKNGATEASLTIADVGGTGKALVLSAISTGSWASNVTVTIDYDGLPAAGKTGYDQFAFNLDVTNIATGATRELPCRHRGPGPRQFRPGGGERRGQRIRDDPCDQRGSIAHHANARANRHAAAAGPHGRDRGRASHTGATTVGTAGAVAGFALDHRRRRWHLRARCSPPAIRAPIPALTPLLRLMQIRQRAALQAKYPGAAVSFTQTRFQPRRKTTPDSVLASVTIPNKPDAVRDVRPGFRPEPRPKPTRRRRSRQRDRARRPLSANVAAYWFGGQVPRRTSSSPSPTAATASSLPTSVQLVGDEAAFTGIYALEKVDLFNILCIPDATRASVGESKLELDSTVGSPERCLGAGDGLLQAAPRLPADRSTADRSMISHRPSPGKPAGSPSTTSNGAAYFPRARLPDPLNNNNALRTFAPCGVMAGVYASIDGRAMRKSR